MKVRSGRPYAIVATIFSLALAGAANAQDWHFEPDLRVGGELDDNATLSTRTDEEVELTGYLAEASARISYASPATQFYVTPRFLLRRYSDDPVYDSEDAFLSSEYSHDTLSSTLSLRFNYERENVRTAERDDADLEDIDPGDIIENATGEVDIKGRRLSLHARPRWEYRLSDSSRIDTRVDFFDVSYEDELIIAGLTDYTDTRFRFSYLRDFSQRNTGIITATARNYNADDILDDTTGYGLAAGFTRNLTENSLFRALVGVENTERFLQDDSQNFVFDLYYRQRLETILLIAQYRRSVIASGAGRLTARDSVNLRFTRQLSDKLSAGLGVRAYQTTGLSDISIIERDYVQLRSQLTWSLSSAFSLEANYAYTFIRRSNLDDSANSNNINLWFVYHPIPGR